MLILLRVISCTYHLLTAVSRLYLARLLTTVFVFLKTGGSTVISEGEVGRNFFVAKGKLAYTLKLWWYPPAQETKTQPPPDIPPEAVPVDASKDVDSGLCASSTLLTSPSTP